MSKDTLTQEDCDALAKIVDESDAPWADRFDLSHALEEFCQKRMKKFDRKRFIRRSGV